MFKDFRVLMPIRHQPREHHIKVESAGCLYPKPHEPFDLRYPVAGGVLVQLHPVSEGQYSQFSYTVAFVLTDWYEEKNIIHCVWHLVVSPSSPEIELAFNLPGSSGSVIDQFKRFAETCSNLPLVKGSCFWVKIGHCGEKPPVMEPGADFLHGVPKIQERRLAQISKMWRWTYRVKPRGFMIVPKNMWEDAREQRLLEIIFESLKTLARSIIVRVESIRVIQRRMVQAGISSSPSTGETIVLSGSVQEAQAAKRRVGRDNGFTRYIPPAEQPSPPPFPMKTGAVTVTIPSSGKLKKS